MSTTEPVDRSRHALLLACNAGDEVELMAKTRLSLCQSVKTHEEGFVLDIRKSFSLAKFVQRQRRYHCPENIATPFPLERDMYQVLESGLQYGWTRDRRGLFSTDFFRLISVEDGIGAYKPLKHAAQRRAGHALKAAPYLLCNDEELVYAQISQHYVLARSIAGQYAIINASDAVPVPRKVVKEMYQARVDLMDRNPQLPVLGIEKSGLVRVVSGRLLHCKNRTQNTVGYLTQDYFQAQRPIAKSDKVHNHQGYNYPDSCAIILAQTLIFCN